MYNLKLNKQKMLLCVAIVIFATVFSNIMWIEVLVGRKLATIDIGMTENEVRGAIGKPHANTISKYYDSRGGQNVDVGSKRHYEYCFPYCWDYILFFSLYRSRGIQVIFGENGRVIQIETRRYLSKYWYVEQSG